MHFQHTHTKWTIQPPGTLNNSPATSIIQPCGETTPQHQSSDMLSVTLYITNL